MRTLLGVAALAALHRGRVAATVDEEDGLLALGQAVVQAVDQPARERDRPALLHRLDAHVDHVDEGQLAVVDALGEAEQPVFARLGVGPGFERRRGGTEQADRPAELGAVDRGVAPVVARGLVLLVGRLVLLIHHDEPQVRHRGENRRARAHHHPRLAGGQGEPAVEPLAFAERTMPDDRAVVRRDGLQPRTQARHGLRGERHFGHEEGHAAAGRERFLDGAQVDLGLARAGDPEEQTHREAARLHVRREGVDRRLLFVVERVGPGGDVFARRVVVVVGDAFDAARLLAHQSALDQPGDGGGRHREPVEHKGLRDRARLGT